MTHKLRLLLLLLVLAGGTGLWALSGGGAQPDRAGGGPHAQSLGPEALRRELKAVDATLQASSSAALVAEGRKLFRSSAVALEGESCQSCHTDGGANGELGTIVHPQEPGDFRGPRDPPALWGVARTAPYGWAGDVPTLEAMVVNTVRSHFSDTVTKNDDATEVARLAAPLVAYLQQLEPPRSAFDDGTLNAQQLRGEKLFQGKAGCIACHTGVLFTDGLIHDTGVRAAPDSNDPGAPPPPAPPGTTPTPGPFIDNPQLRDLVNSAPYMHNGTEKTLTEVVQFYNSRSLLSPLRLTEAEIADLVAFLEGL